MSRLQGESIHTGTQMTFPLYYLALSALHRPLAHSLFHFLSLSPSLCLSFFYTLFLPTSHAFISSSDVLSTHVLAILTSRDQLATGCTS